MERKKITQKEEKKDDKREGKSGIFKKNVQLHGLFHFVTRAVYILLICYIYENFPINKYNRSVKYFRSI